MIMSVLEKTIDNIYCAVNVKDAGSNILSMNGKESRGLRRIRHKRQRGICGGIEGELERLKKEHGGIAVREYCQAKERGWYTEKDKWKNLKSFGAVRKTLITDRGKKKKHSIISAACP